MSVLPTALKATFLSARSVTSTEAPMGPEEFDPTAKPNAIYKFIVGRNQGTPIEMTPAEADQMINGPFANLLLKKNIYPLTLNHVVEAFKQTVDDPNGLDRTDNFLIAENGQIPWKKNARNVDQTARPVVVMGVKEGIGPDVLVSTSTQVDSESTFLQLMSWDPRSRAYNFYQRLNGLWIWSGNSFDALASDTRGKGPFSGHLNGGPVMKELKLPWQNWNSISATIGKNAFPSDDPFLTTPYFEEKQSADIFEKSYKAGAVEWNRSRIAEAIQERSGVIKAPEKLLRQIICTTNVNLTSSATASGSVDASSSDIRLPFSFFANFEALEVTGVQPEVGVVKIKSAFYLESLKIFDFALKSNKVSIPGDTHFAFFVPEPAFEDTNLLSQMIESEVMSKKLAACLLMTDFSNPIYSRGRACLERYVPKEIVAGDQGKDLDEKFVGNVYQSENRSIPNTPEYQFLENWNIAGEEWIEDFQGQVVKYFEKIDTLCQTQEGYNQLVRLAESRRNEFKQTGLYEFALTFATTNIDESSPLEITPEGVVQPVTLYDSTAAEPRAMLYESDDHKEKPGD